MSGSSVCLLVQRAGVTVRFLLRGDVVKFGYAPGGPNDLVLYDSLLEDEQGVIEYQAGTSTDGFTGYQLKAKSEGIKVNGTPLPAHKSASIRLKLGQIISVGEHYQIEVATSQKPESHPGAGAKTAQENESERFPIPAALADYLRTSRLLLGYLPEIYRPHVRNPINEGSDVPAPATLDSLLARFLGLFESVFLPLQWTVRHFDLFLDPKSSPSEFLPWLADWYGLPVDLAALPEATQRTVLTRLPELVARKGTYAGLAELLDLLLDTAPAIEDDVAPNRFTVETQGIRLKGNEHTAPEHQAQIDRLIDWYKPAFVRRTTTE